MKKKLPLIIAFVINFTLLKAQLIPNAGFENWTNISSYSNPDGWDSFNNFTLPSGTFTCEQGIPGAVGNYYLKLTSKTVQPFGVMPGKAISGKFNQFLQPLSGFAYTAQPEALTGKWQHMIFGTSQGFIDIKLTKWNSATNSRTEVANGHIDLTGMAMSWANFSVPLAYLETFAPDTCIILMSASGTDATENDYLWVDDLAFTGNVAGFIDLNNKQNIKLFPNPSANKLNIDLSAIKSATAQIMIFDMQGKLNIEVKNIQASSNYVIDISELAQGNYILNIIADHQFSSQKFVKQ